MQVWDQAVVLPIVKKSHAPGRSRTLQKKARTMLTVNERGQVIGESHPGAVLTDHEVDLMLELRAEGYSFAWLATKFEVSRSCAALICWGKRRAQIPAGYKRARGPAGQR